LTYRTTRENNPNRGKRPITDKLAAALAWLMTGSADEAETLCGVPARTIRGWTAEESWALFMEQARREKQSQLDAKFTAIIHKATDAILDRLEHGDEVVTKDGRTVKRAVGIRDLSVVKAIAFDKRNIARGMPTSISARGDQKKHLADVKKELENMGGAADEGHGLGITPETMN
jgi:hypothetical protein